MADDLTCYRCRQPIMLEVEEFLDAEGIAQNYRFRFWRSMTTWLIQCGEKSLGLNHYPDVPPDLADPKALEAWLQEP